MLPGFDLIQFAQTAGPWAALAIVAIIIFAESGLLIGFFLPGDSMLFTLGFLIQGSSSFHLDINIYLACFILFVAAVIGDNVGYSFGRKLGPLLFNKKDSRLFKQENVIKAQEFYNKYGGKTIIFARFIPIVRTFVPLIAGVAKMDYKTFFLFNLIGGFTWTFGVVFLGYSLGSVLHSFGIEIDTILLPLVALILFISILPAVYHLLKEKTQREIIWNATKNEIKRIFKIK